MAQTSNQFSMALNKGQLTLSQNWDTLNCVISANEVATLVNGQAVLLVDEASVQLPVENVAAITNAIFGFIPYSTKTNEYVAGDSVKVAKNGDVMVMEASAAIARGADLEIVISGDKVATQSTGTTIGTALDKAAADGDLIRVLITV